MPNEMASSEESAVSATVPNAYTLNYPNPFNPSTTGAYAVG